MALGLRFLFALFLVLVTYNPTSFNYVRWAMEQYQFNLSIVVLNGLLLLVGYIIFLRATWRSIGPNGLLDPQNSALMTWIALICVSFILAVGLSWSHIRRRISGQSDMDDIGD